MLQLFLTFLACFTILAALIPLIRTDIWWVRSLDFPRGQLGVFGLVVWGALFFQASPFSTFEVVLLSALPLSLLFLVYRIFPYAPIAPLQAQNASNDAASESIRILCSNVLQSNRNAAKLLGLIKAKAPDLILVVETDDWWEEALDVIEEDYPHQVKRPLDNTYGMLLYSKLEIEESEIKFLIEPDIPSIFTILRLPSGREAHVIGVHPKPPRPDKQQDSTTRDAELLIVAKYVEHLDGPVIVAGDFNDVAWSHTTRLFQRISGLLDPRRGRGFFSTFHADYPFFRYPLDHIFHSTHFSVQTMERLAHIGSDHFPVYAALVLDEKASSTEELQPDEVDEEEAKAMIRKAFE